MTKWGKKTRLSEINQTQKITTVYFLCMHSLGVYCMCLCTCVSVGHEIRKKAITGKKEKGKGPAQYTGPERQ